MTGVASLAPLVLGVAWAALLLALAWRHRPAPARARSLIPPRTAVATPARCPLGQAVGDAVLRLAGRPAGAPRSRRVGRAVLAGLAAAVVTPWAVLPAAALLWAWPVVQARRRRRHRLDEVVAELPELVDLLVLAVGAGYNVRLALAAVATRSAGPLGAELQRVGRELAVGRRVADVLDELPGRLGEPVRPLVGALTASERYGAPLLEGLVRLADEVRHDRRRRAEEVARRIPVKLLFPLVCCTLPALALLTVVPLVATGLRSLRL